MRVGAETFTLQPFGGAARGFAVTAEVGADSAHLLFRWQVTGPSERITMPPISAPPTRAHRLWEHTCFEAFFAAPSAEPYTELNCAPSGDWNLYEFAGYREHMREAAVALQPPRIERTSEHVRATARVPKPPLPTLALNLAVILCFTDHAKEWFALGHPGRRPDFHDRRSWHTLSLNTPGFC